MAIHLSSVCLSVGLCVFIFRFALDLSALSSLELSSPSFVLLFAAVATITLSFTVIISLFSVFFSVRSFHHTSFCTYRKLRHTCCSALHFRVFSSVPASYRVKGPSWETPEINGTYPITEYRIYRDGNLIATLPPDELSFPLSSRVTVPFAGCVKPVMLRSFAGVSLSITSTDTGIS